MDNTYYETIRTNPKEREKIKAAVLSFQKKPSEKNKKFAFLKYYAEENEKSK